MRITSELLANAISFAKSQPSMAKALQLRDNDPNLYLLGLACKMNVYTNDANRFYLRVIFDYAAFNNPDTRTPDLFIDLQTHADGTFVVLPPPVAPAE